MLERDLSLTDQQREHLEVIARSGHHLLALINEILDVAKIESGRMSVALTEFSLHEMLEDMRLMFQFRAQAKQLSLELDRQDMVPRFVRTDEGKLRQILINLIGNAVKFTDTGGVVIRARTVGNDQAALRLEVEVVDTGSGMSPEESEQIFDKFQQFGPYKQGGAGLGLTISRRLVEMLGGEISVTSTPGEGSVFRFHILVEQVDSITAEANIDVRHVVGLEDDTIEWRVLVVDDQPDNSALLEALLEPVGFQVKTAEDGAKGVELFKDWQPHIVLMDLRMPVMDGYEATRRIKATERGSNTPVIAVTASVFGGEEDAVLEAGVDGYLPKPFQTQVLFNALKEHLNLSYVYQDTSGDSGTYTGSGHSAWNLSGDDLDLLPETMIVKMLRAVEDGDMFAFKDLLGDVKLIDKDIAGQLRVLADAFDYDKLQRVLGDGENASE